jgi:damage-control phosphatase, subfamily I
MDNRCLACHAKTVKLLIDKFRPPKDIASDFSSEVNHLLTDFKHLSNPYLVLLIHRLAKKKLQNIDLYSVEKKHANSILYSQYEKWNSFVTEHNEPLRIASKLAVVGNVIDYGAHSVPADIPAKIEELIALDFAIDNRDEMFSEIKKADSVLYLGDNAGEIVFDKLFIQHLNHPNLTYAVRGNPIINDVTLEDAEQVGMYNVCKLISNGHDAPSTLVDNCSAEFQGLFKNADVVLSKGQGNFEGLFDEKRESLYFMLMAKCDVIAEMLGVCKGDLIITKNRRGDYGI